MEGEIGAGGYNEVRSNRELTAMELKTNGDGTENKVQANRERGAMEPETNCG